MLFLWFNKDQEMVKNMTFCLLKDLPHSFFCMICKYWQRVGLYCSLILFLSGCGTIAIINKDESDLMPKTVALSIFTKYGFQEWAEKPFLANIGSLCGTEKEYIEFSDIEAAIYNRNALSFVKDQREKRHFCPVLRVNFPKISEAQALELTNAARALGATKIDKLLWAL